MERGGHVAVGMAVGGVAGIVSGDPEVAFWGVIVGGGVGALFGPHDDAGGGGLSSASRTRVPPASIPRIPKGNGPTDTVESLTYSLAFLDQAFEARQLHEISYQVMRTELQRRLARLSETAAGAPPIPPPPPPPPPPPTTARPTPARPPRFNLGNEEPPDQEPQASQRTQRMRSARELIASDFALHGLAYLGVLLVFAGTLGFVIFSFGEVRMQFRPLAEAAIPLVLFGSAWFLRKRDAPFAAKGLTFLGGALLPIVVAASFVDGTAVPPDLEGSSLVLALAIVAMAIAVSYGAWSITNPESPLRFLAAPMAWASLFALGLAFGGESPTGGVTLTAAQMALTCVAVLATLVAARLAGDNALARASEMAAIPGIVVTYALALVFAFREGWPVAPLVFAGLATMAAAELERGRLGREIAIASQLIVAAFTLWAMTQGLGATKGGAVVVLGALALAEWYLAKGHDEATAAAGAALIGVVGLAATAADPAVALPTWSLVAVWSHLRRRHVDAVAERVGMDVGRAFDAAAAVAAVGAAVFVVIRYPTAGLEMVAVAVCAGAVLNRWPGGDDFYRWWLPTCSWFLLGGTIIRAGASGPDGALAAAATLGAVALVLGRDRTDLRVWTTSAAATWAGWLVFEAVDTPTSVRLRVGALVALAVVVVACGLRPRTWAGHLEAAGHLGTLALLVLPSAGWTRVAALTAWCGGWAAATVAEETGGAPLAALLSEAVFPEVSRARATFRRMSIVFVTTGLPFVALQTGYRSGLFRDHRPWAGLAMSLLALAYAGGTRLWPDHREMASVLAPSGFVLSLIAVGITAPEQWPTIGAVAAVIGAVAATHPTTRHAFMVWVAWIASVPLALLLASASGIGTSDLFFVLMTWGTLLMIGGLAAQRFGRAGTLASLSEEWTRPTAVGALALPAGLAFAFTKDPTVLGVSCLATALVYFAAAKLIRLGGVSGASWALAVVAVSVMLPTSPLDRPWLFVPMAALLLAASWLLRESDVDPWSSWSLPPLVVAHGVAAVALARSADVGDVALTWGGFAVMSLAVWAWRRHWEWAWAADGLALVAAGVMGHGWLALALAVTAAAIQAAARYERDASRSTLSAVAALAGGAAWIQLLVWSGWPPARCAMATAVASGLMALVVAYSIRVRNLDRLLWIPWAALSAGGVAFACLTALETPTTVTLIGAAVGLGLAAFAVGACAWPLDLDVLRESATVLLVAGVAYLEAAMHPSGRELVMWNTGAGLGLVILALALRSLSTDSPWLRPVVLAGSSATVVSVATALALDDTRVLSFALLVAGLEAAAASFVLSNHHLAQVSLGLFCLSWIAFATGWAHEVDWYTVPVGATLLAGLEIERWVRRREQLAMPEDLRPLEYVGMGLLVGAPVLQIIQVSPNYGPVAIALGAVLVIWGGATRVRRRVLFGATTIIVAVTLMLAGPIARIIPHFRGTSLWIALAVAGVLLLVVATSLERGRARAHKTMARLSQLMDGWE